MSEMDMDLDGGFSLADLANIDLEGIEEVRYDSLPKGVYEFEVTNSAISPDSKDGEPRYKVEFELTVLEMLSSIEPGVNLETQSGKKQTERFFIYPKKTEEEAAAAIGRIKAFVNDIEADSTGTLGTVVANAKGTRFRARIEHKPDRNDPSTKYARLKLERKQSA